MKTSTKNRRLIAFSRLSLKLNNRIAIGAMLVMVFLFSAFLNVSASVTLVKDGKPVLTLLVDDALLPLDQTQVSVGFSERGEKKLDGYSEQRRAVLELINYVEQMSGAKLKVEAAKKGATGCYVGLGSSFPWLNQDVTDLGDEGFIVRAEGKNIYLLAQKPLGVRHAVTTLLMDHGCRWFFPGTTWEEVPQKSTINVTSTKQIPSFPMGRTIWYGFGTYPQPANDQAEWNYHNRMGSSAPVSIGHTGYGIDVVSDFKAHPEWFALVKGQRKPNKVCYSNPEVIQQMIKYALDQAANGAASVSLTPADGLGYCECDLCRSTAKGGEVREEKGSFFAIRPDGELICTVSETLFNAVNQVARAVGEKYQDVMLGCYGYSAYSHPPSFKLKPNVFIQTTTHYRRTPLTLEEQMNQWGERASQVGIRGYWSVYQWDWDNPVVGKFVPDTIQKDLQLYNKHNGTAFNTEASNNWGPRGLSYYIGSQLLWDVNADIKPLIRDFYEKAFGPAAQSMERYYMCWYGPSVGVLNSASGKGLNDKGMQIGLDEFADYNLKSTSASKTTLAAAFKHLDEASRLVSGHPKYQERVDQIRMYAYYLLLREKVREAAAAGNDNAVVEAIKNETEFGGRLTNTNMIHTMPLLSKAFMRLFKDYEPLLKDIPESQTAGEGWRQVGEPPTHDELEKLWAEGKKYLSITDEQKADLIVLIQNGKANMKILVDPATLPLNLPADSHAGKPSTSYIFDEEVSGPGERRIAVQNLIKYLNQISGVELSAEVAKEGATGVYVGLVSDFPWLNLELDDLGLEGFVIRSEGKNLYLVANSSLGVRAAVTTFLTELGCRWFFPGEVWEVIPAMTTIEGSFNLREEPSFYTSRVLWYGYGTRVETKDEYEKWFYFNRMGGPRPMRGGHSLYGINVDSAMIYNPDWIAEVNGIRKPASQKYNTKFCFSNPGVVQQMKKNALKEVAEGATSVGLVPADGLGYCECDLCKSTARGGEIKPLHGTLFATRPDGELINIVSETYFNAVNQVAKAVYQENPNVDVFTLAYSAYSHPPSFKMEPNVVILTTTHFRRTPISLEEQLLEWGQRVKILGIYGYWSVYQWDYDRPYMGKDNPGEIQENLRMYNSHNVSGFNTEASNNWGPRGLTYYIGSNLLWNLDADIHALAHDFYTKAFGPAADVMERFYVRTYGTSVSSAPGDGSNNSETEDEEHMIDEFAGADANKKKISKETLIGGFHDLDEALTLVKDNKQYRDRIDHLRMYYYFLLLYEKLEVATETGNKKAIVGALKNMTEYGMRLLKTHMIHSTALGSTNGFKNVSKPYVDLIKDIPKAQVPFEGWRKPGEPPSQAELDQLWSEGKKYLGISTSSSTISLPKRNSTPYPFKFIDVGNELGIFPDASNIRGHGAGWGDVDGDGRIDLYVGTFNDSISKPNMLFLNKKGKFVLSEQQSVRISTRSTGVIFADLDNDGDLDLYVGSMPKKEKGFVGNSMFENNGKGEFTDISENNVACPPAFGGRSVTVLDYDGDGLLDILAGEDVFPGYNGSKTKSSRLFRNKGGLEFEDVSAVVGIPDETPGYGVAAADVNNDGWPDFFIAASDGGNKLFINNQDGTFTEAKSLNKLFEWPGSGGDKMVCGISFGDVNRDGMLDIILGPHFVMPAKDQQPVRLFLNQGNDKNGIPNFIEVTEEAGLNPIPMKSPHVEFQDFDNDGWPDISTSVVRFKDGKPYPTIFRHAGLNKNGIPVYHDFEINDFPTKEDIEIDKSSDFWDKMLEDGKIIYAAPAPTGDFNNDGKMDIFLPMWWVETPSLLLRNESSGGNWLQVVVSGSNGTNRMGVGAKVNIYKKGKLGDKDNLLGTQDISVGYGYASGQQAMAHFGLGKLKNVDVEVILPHGKGIRSERKVKVNQRITIK